MISEINLENFRCFSKLNISCKNKLVIIQGKNAVGKTSILESIYLSSTTKSHRTNDIKTLIKKENKQSIIEIKENYNYKILLNKENKLFFINKVQIKKTSEYVGNLNVVLFSPTELYLINGSPSERRKFLDLNISILFKDYLTKLNNYKKILLERNELLKSNKIDEILLDVYTNELIENMKVIHNYRMNFIDRINYLLENITKNMNIENIKIKYLKTYNEQDMLSSFLQKRNQDIFLKTTSLGTHRDDFVVLINNVKASEYASEGQKRTICISIMLALKEYIYEITANEPILLLDDVFMALDSNRVENITKYVINSKQCFITTTSLVDIPKEILDKSLVLKINNEGE